ncbi:unnamed protein product, partial [Prorocentrum cordatum]
MCVLVLQRVSFSCPEKGEELIPNSITTVGSSTMMGGRAMGFAGSTTVSPIVTSSMPEKAQMSPAATSSTTLLSLLWKSQSLLTFARLTSPSGPNMKPSSWPTTRLPEMTRPMEMRPMKGSKSRFETSICRGAWASTLGLGHSSRIWSRSGDRSSRVWAIQRGHAQEARGIADRKVADLVAGAKVAEQVESGVEHPVAACCRLIDLVDANHDLATKLQRLLQHKLGLRHWTFLRVYEEEASIRHVQNPLDLAAEVGVPRSVDDVDLDAFPINRRVLRKDGDAPLRLDLVTVHGSNAVILRGLGHERVRQRGLAVIDVRDDGNVADVFTLDDLAHGGLIGYRSRTEGD